MKFSKYGAPSAAYVKSDFLTGSLTALISNRSSAGSDPVVVNQAARRSGVCINMMKSAATCGYFVQEVTPTVCEVVPIFPAYGPVPQVGIVVTSTLSAPALATKFGASLPAVIVIAAVPSTHNCCAWEISRALMSLFQHL